VVPSGPAGALGAISQLREVKVAVLTNIRAATPQNLFFRTGTLTVNGVSVGALQGNIVFSVRKTDHIPTLAGAAGEVTGTRFRLREEAFLAGEVVEWTLLAIAYAISGISVSSNASSEVLGSSDDSSDVVGCIGVDNYVDVVFQGQQCDGHNTTITLKRAIFDGDLEVTWEDQGHMHFAVVFKATYDPVDPDMRPYVITHRTA